VFCQHHLFTLASGSSNCASTKSSLVERRLGFGEFLRTAFIAMLDVDDDVLTLPLADIFRSCNLQNEGLSADELQLYAFRGGVKGTS